MMASLERKLEYITQCPICWEIFEEPKHLPCDHTLCLSCLTKLAKASASTNTYATYIVCPICRRTVLLPNGGVHQFPTNLTVVSLIGMLYGSERSTIDCQFCLRKCVKSNAEYQCKQCSKYICSSCSRDHGEIDVFSDHEIIHINDTRFNCTHHGEPYSYGCNTCTKPLCVYCVQGKECQHHKVNTWIPQEKNMKDIVKDLMTAMARYDEMNIKRTESIDNEIKLICEELQKVETHKQNLIDRIEVEGNRCIDGLKQHFNHLMSAKKIIINNYLENASIFQSIKNAIFSSMGQQNDMSLHPKIKLLLETMMMPEEKENPLTHTIVFVPEDSMTVGTLKWDFVNHDKLGKLTSNHECECVKSSEITSMSQHSWDNISLVDIKPQQNQQDRYNSDPDVQPHIEELQEHSDVDIAIIKHMDEFEYDTNTQVANVNDTETGHETFNIDI